MQIILCPNTMQQQTIRFYDEVVLYLEQHINYPVWRYQRYPCAETVSSAISARTQYLCIEDGDLVGGFVLDEESHVLCREDIWSKSLQKGEYLVIHALAVKPDCQKKGIGSAMVQYCIDAAKKSGYKAIRMNVIATNTPAIHLYQKFGFQRCGPEFSSLENDVELRFMLFELNF